jgi:hypothetical protein
MLIFEPSEDNDRELISAYCNELSKNEAVNLKELHSPHSHGSSELLNDMYSVGETLAHLMWLQ